MKTAILLVLISLAAIGQDSAVIDNLDELYRAQKAANQRLETIELNLQKCHHQYTSGLCTSLVGVVFAGAAVPMFWASDGLGIATLAASGILTTVGAVIMIDSHKFIGRAARRRK